MKPRANAKTAGASLGLMPPAGTKSMLADAPHAVPTTKQRADMSPRRSKEFAARVRARLASRLAADMAGLPPCPPDATPSISADLNRVHLTGRLGSEPRLRDVGDHPLAELTLTSTTFSPAVDGALQRTTTWFNLSAWEELAEQCGRQFHCGDQVYVEGCLHLWTDSRPPHRYACHTIVLDRIVLLAAGPGPQSEAG